MINYILIFIASVAGKIKKRPMSISEWANTPRKIPPYLESAINQIQDDKIEKVIVKKNRTFDTSPLYVFANEETAKNFVTNRVEPNSYQSALAISPERRTPFEKWKALDRQIHGCPGG